MKPPLQPPPLLERRMSGTTAAAAEHPPPPLAIGTCRRRILRTVAALPPPTPRKCNIVGDDADDDDYYCAQSIIHRERNDTDDTTPVTTTTTTPTTTNRRTARNNVSPLEGCRFVVVYYRDDRPIGQVQYDSNNKNDIPSKTPLLSQRAYTGSRWYLCRIVDRVIQDDDNDDDKNNDTTTFELLECSLNVALIGDFPSPMDTILKRKNVDTNDGKVLPVNWETSTCRNRSVVVVGVPNTSNCQPVETTPTVTLLLRNMGHTNDDGENISKISSPPPPLFNDTTTVLLMINPVHYDHHPKQLSSIFMTYHCTPSSSLGGGGGGVERNSSDTTASPVSLSHQPLLQSCIKRQLVGCHICIWNNNNNKNNNTGSNTNSGNNNNTEDHGSTRKTTRIQLTFDHNVYTFIVDSVATVPTTTMSPRTILHHQPSSNVVVVNDDFHFDIGIILPSTRITFLEHPIIATTTTAAATAITGTELVQPSTTGALHTNASLLRPSKIPSASMCSNNTNIEYHSPAVRVLFDTIQCIYRIQQQSMSSVSLTSSSSSVVPRIYGDIPRAFLLSGPPGVGKTHAIRTVVNLVTKELGCLTCHLVAIQGSEILSMGGQYTDAARVLERYFQNAVRQMKNNTNRCTIIFLDECDALLSSSTNESSSSSLIIEMTLGRLLDQMNNVSVVTGGDPIYHRLMVVAATNRVDAIPMSLRRPGRFDRDIPMVPPDATTRLQILQSLLGSTSRHETSDTDEERLTPTELQFVADVCVGFVPADLAAVVRKVELHSIIQTQRKVEVQNNVNFACTVSDDVSYFDIWTRAISDVGASALRDAALKAPPTTKWDDIAGDPGGAKTALRQAIEWPRTKRDAYVRLGLTPPRGILLHGPPGCAKTSLARAAAGASAVSFLSLSPADVYSTSYVGDAEAVIRRTFTLARSASPCVLFFDEIDAILGMNENDSNNHNGMGRGSAVEARVLSTFLNEMDGVDGSWKDGVLVLGATNRPWTLDAALLRPGRFDKVIYVPPPDIDGRREILSIQCQNWSKHLTTKIDVNYLASDSVSGTMTGAEIVGACREAAMTCFREATTTAMTTTTMLNPSKLTTAQLVVKQEYLESALRNVRPILSNPSVMEEFQSFQRERTRQVG